MDPFLSLVARLRAAQREFFAALKAGEPAKAAALAALRPLEAEADERLRRIAGGLDADRAAGDPAVLAVVAMRAKQREWVRWGGPDLTRECRDHERRVDRLVEEAREAAQPRLF